MVLFASVCLSAIDTENEGHKNERQGLFKTALLPTETVNKENVSTISDSSFSDKQKIGTGKLNIHKANTINETGLISGIE